VQTSIYMLCADGLHYIGFILIAVGIFRRMLHVMEETRALALENKNELSHLKLFLMPQLSEDVSAAMNCLSRPFETDEQMLRFCDNLGDADFRRSVVRVHNEF